MEINNTIVVAWCETVVVPGQCQADLGERREMKVVVPVAAVWMYDGTEQELARALEFVKEYGWHVFTYDESEEDPLGRAKIDVMRMQK